jgi:hypothetical protein
MAVDTLSNALGTTPTSLIRGFGSAGGTKERADYARKNLGTAFEEGARAEEEAAKAQFGIEQGQVQKQAAAERDFANRSREEASLLERQTKPYQEFVAPEIKASDYAKNAGMRLLSALLIGGVAGASGRAQMTAIKEMQDAEDAGQRERFNSAKLKFDEADRARKDNNNMLKDRFERMLSLLSKDRNAALVEAKLIEGKVGNGLIAAQLRAKNYPKAYELFTKAIAAQEAAEAELLKQQTMFEQKKILKMTPSGGKVGGGSGGGKSGKIQQLPAQLEKKLDEIGTTFVTLNRANQSRKAEYFGIAPSDDIANMIIAGVERGLPVNDIMRAVGSRAPKVTVDTVNWWKDYQAFVAQVRNKLFGATLTPREAEDFRKFTLSPATAPNVADAYFNNQVKIIRSAIERERRKASARGVNDDTISAYLDVPDEGGAPTPPVINTQKEFNALPPDTEYIDGQTGKRGRTPKKAAR